MFYLRRMSVAEWLPLLIELDPLRRVRCLKPHGSGRPGIDRSLGARRREDGSMDQRAGAVTAGIGRQFGFDPFGTGADQDALTYAVTQLRSQVDELDLPFEVEDVADARADRQFVLDRLDEYVLPRVGRL